MNELFFFLHLTIVSACCLFALKKGKMVLISWICLQAVLANLFVLKQICFLGAHVTCSDAYAVGTIFGLNLLREYFGRDVAKQTLWNCFFVMIFFMVMSQLHLLYIPSLHDTTHLAYEIILSPSPRLLTASLLTFLCVQHLDLRLFNLLKKRGSNLPFSVRNAVATLVSQGLDTFLFSFLGLYGLVAVLSHVILVSFALKILVIVLMSPLIHFSKHLVPKEA